MISVVIPTLNAERLLPRCFDNLIAARDAQDSLSGSHEPWIDADCSTLWFRRGGVTFMAKKQ